MNKGNINFYSVLTGKNKNENNNYWGFGVWVVDCH